MDRRNSALSDALRPVPKFAVGDWVWVYNTAATIRQGAKTDTDAKVLKTKLSLNWTGLSGPSWKREMDLQPFCHELLRCWAGTPNQRRQTKRLYRRM